MTQYGAALAISILTMVRSEWTYKKLQLMSVYGQDTPVSGDALARLKHDLAKARV